jgi:hypothetical protein
MALAGRLFRPCRAIRMSGQAHLLQPSGLVFPQLSEHELIVTPPGHDVRRSHAVLTITALADHVGRPKIQYCAP